MIKNRTAQLIFQTVYCALGFVGCVACLGIFDNINMIRWDFYVHFTNISNFLCFGVMLCTYTDRKEKRRQLRYRGSSFKIYRCAWNSSDFSCF